MRRLAPLAAVPAALLGVLVLSGCTAQVPETSTGEPTGRWGSMDDALPHVEFLADGRAFFFDGCNGGGGRWSQDAADAEVVIGGMTTSLIWCPAQGPYLAMAEKAIVAGDALLLVDEAGEVVEVLLRTA